MTGVGAHPTAGSEARQIHKTLVMEETKARQHSADLLGSMAVSAMAPTALPPHGAGAMQMPAPQPSPRPAVQSVPPPSAESHALKATTRMAVEDTTDPGLAHVKATVRMAHEPMRDPHGPPPSQPSAHGDFRRLPPAAWADPTNLTRRPQPKKGLTGFFDELPGTTGLIIGVGLGLGIAGGAILAFILLR